ncbi:MAG: NAD(P)H-hydrate epimerase [Frankiales bacterium]|nr:NAD(P)H-hydrate epimerase [Frankiales bacterium]
MSPTTTAPRPATVALDVETVRRVEAEAMARLPEGTLMARAATAVAVSAGQMLRDLLGRVTGARVVLLVGAGDNGGDALHAGARLATRGARVDALLVADRHHEAGADALRRAGGRLHVVDGDLVAAAELVAAADLVVDGVLGIGGRGALREPAATLAAVARETDASVLAVDLPSGVDADTGVVEDADRAVRADRTVVMGALKPGLLVGEGARLSGDLEVVDIGLDLGGLDPARTLVLVDDELAASVLARPGAGDDKYTRGVVGLSTGSERYPGAAILSTAGARHGTAGYVRYSGPAHAEVVRAWPDVVAKPGRVGVAGRAQCWVVGCGRGTDEDARLAILDAAAPPTPLVLDADALTLLAEDAEVRAAVISRPGVTVLTPHDGELARLAGGRVGPDRLAAAREVADAYRAVVLLKGSATVVVAPDGPSYVAVAAPPELATAGTGDVLAGVLGSLLAGVQARGQVDPASAARVAGAAAHVHGLAGALAARGGRPVASPDVAAALPEAVARLRAARPAGA